MQGRAHLYGDMSRTAEEGSYDDISDVLQSEHNYLLYHRTESYHQQVAYRFKEYNQKDTQRLYPFFTNRTFIAESANCSTYDEISAHDNNPTNFTISKTGSTDKQWIVIPDVYLNPNGTTYIYQGFHDPVHAPWFSCGDRCVKMWAYKNPPRQNATAFYECSVAISIVANASEPQHAIPDDMAKLAAAAIALGGQIKGLPNNLNNRQYRFYALG